MRYRMAETSARVIDNLQGGQDVNRFLVGVGDLVAIGEVGGRGGVDGDHEAQGHHHRQDQREKLFQISHWFCFLLVDFCRRKRTFRAGSVAMGWAIPSCSKRKKRAGAFPPRP